MSTISRILIFAAAIPLFTGCTLPSSGESDPGQNPWSTPAEVGAAGGSICWKKMAANNEGEAILTWHYQTSGEGAAIKMYSGNSWGEEINLGADLNSDPAIFINDDGNAFVAWLRAEGNYLQVWARRYVKGAGWSQDALIDVTECVTDNYRRIMIAADNQGTAVLVWGQPASSTWRRGIWTSRYVDVWGWSDPVQLSDGDYDTECPRVISDGAGNYIASWTRIASPYHLMAKRYIDGSGWETAVSMVSEEDKYAFMYDIAFDGQGNAFAVWQQSDVYGSDSRRMYANRCEAGSVWETPVPLETDTRGSIFSPCVAADSAGNAYAVWAQEITAGVDFEMYAWCARFGHDAGWGTALCLSGTGGTQSTDPDVSVDENRNAFVVWLQEDWDVGLRCWAGRYVDGTGWEAFQPLDHGDAEAFTPNVGADRFGKALAVWSQHSQNEIKLFYSKYR